MAPHIFDLCFIYFFITETWGWELTVALRKVSIALLGVFGHTIDMMQVHLTIMLMVGVILLTSTVRPFGGEFQQTLHNIEIMSLTCTFLTLWAGSVFNTYPQCEDPTKSSGETLVWCDALSFIVSLINFFSIGVFVVVYFIARRGDEQKVTKAAIQKERRSFGTFAELELDNENEESSGVELTPLSQPQHRGSEISNVLIDNAWERHLDEVSGNWYAHNRASGATVWEADKKKSRSIIVYQEQKTKTKTKTKTKAKGTLKKKDPEIDPDTKPQHHVRNSTQLPPDWEKHNDTAGTRYYSNTTTQQSSWTPPKGATGGSTGVVAKI